MQKNNEAGAPNAVADLEVTLGDAVATVAVRDLETARRFYEDGLGLKRVSTEGEEAITYSTGNSTLLIYRSDYAGTNQATSVTWSVGEQVEEVANALKGKGVVFEQYEMPGMTRRGDVYEAGNMKVAWFKDPDGNIHALTGGRSS
jgi:catechol 2,3-dioxygenase-like lactoylglutathione lyase family enzyme